MNRIPLMLMGILAAGLVGLTANVMAASPEIIMTQENGYTLHQGGDFDRESCEQNCRSLYGVDPYFRGGRYGGDRGRYYVYAQCVQDSNTRFWKEFDRKMRDLEDE
jgi:hypothetical protein